MLRETGDAHAGAHVHRLFFKSQGQFERLGNTLCHGNCGLGTAAGQHHGKFITTQAGHHVAGAHVLQCQPLGHGDQQLVAKRVTQHIVDMLEAVNIQHQDGHAALVRVGTACAGGLDLLLHRFAKARPVRQAGQAVPIGQRADLVLLRADVDAHGVKSFSQATDLVVAVGVLHGNIVLAPAQGFGRMDQRSQWRSHTSGGKHAANRKQYYAQAGDPGQGDLGLSERGHHFVD